MALAFAPAAASARRGARRDAGLPPHIVFIVADDLGYNDISLHSSPAQIPTPNIDALADGGVELTNYHVQSVCSPSRSSFLSGRHVIHTGIYFPFGQGTPEHLRTDVTLLPQYLQRCCNYTTHMVGKYHLGQGAVAQLPTSRGFDSYLGYWTGAEDHFTHDTTGAYDFNAGVLPAPQYNNSWSTTIFSARPSTSSAALTRSTAASSSTSPFRTCIGRLKPQTSGLRSLRARLDPARARKSASTCAPWRPSWTKE